MTVYKAYFQSKFDYGISLWGCTTQSNINKIQRMQNRVARIITGCYDFINTRGLDLVDELNLQNITERRNHFLCNLMLKSIHGLAPTYLSDSIVMQADINEYDTRGAQNRNVYQPRPRIEKYKNSFLYMAGELWNALPPSVESPDLGTWGSNVIRHWTLDPINRPNFILMYFNAFPRIWVLIDTVPFVWGSLVLCVLCYIPGDFRLFTCFYCVLFEHAF